MSNQSRGRKNEPPARQRDDRSSARSNTDKLRDRSDVVQAQHGHPELNLGDSEEESMARAPGSRRRKAGR